MTCPVCIVQPGPPRQGPGRRAQPSDAHARPPVPESGRPAPRGRRAGSPEASPWRAASTCQPGPRTALPLCTGVPGVASSSDEAACPADQGHPCGLVRASIPSLKPQLQAQSHHEILAAGTSAPGGPVNDTVTTASKCAVPQYRVHSRCREIVTTAISGTFRPAN